LRWSLVEQGGVAKASSPKRASSKVFLTPLIRTVSTAAMTFTAIRRNQRFGLYY
jgi:hypothetical protein